MTNSNMKINFHTCLMNVYSTILFCACVCVLFFSPMTGRRRPKSVRKARAKAHEREQRAFAKESHSFVFARPGVGHLVKRLSLDLRSIFEPYTASRLVMNRRNVLKDFITIAGPLHVTHMLYLTHPHSERREEKRARQLAKKAARSGVELNSTTIVAGTCAPCRCPSL